MDDVVSGTPGPLARRSLRPALLRAMTIGGLAVGGWLAGTGAACATDTTAPLLPQPAVAGLSQVSVLAGTDATPTRSPRHAIATHLSAVRRPSAGPVRVTDRQVGSVARRATAVPVHSSLDLARPAVDPVVTTVNQLNQLTGAALAAGSDLSGSHRAASLPATPTGRAGTAAGATTVGGRATVDAGSQAERPATAGSPAPERELPAPGSPDDAPAPLEPAAVNAPASARAAGSPEAAAALPGARAPADLALRSRVTSVHSTCPRKHSARPSVSPD